MLVRNRLRSLDGCVTCKRRRKKCDESKPSCGACKRLELRCLWKGDKSVTIAGTSMRKSNCAGIYTPRNVGSKTVLNAGPNLSAFTDLICGTYVLEKCYEGFNLPVDQTWTTQSSTTIRSTLSFAPADESLAWGCIVGQGLLMIGNRYHDSRVINAGMLQQNVILRKVCAAIADEKKRHHLDTVAAIDNLFMSTATTIGFAKPGVSDEMSCHVVGFLTIMDTMRPESFQDERALALLEHVRLSKIMVSLMLKHDTVLTSKFWRTIPWAKARRGKSSAQKLVDLLCDVASLQTHLKTTFPYSKPNLEISHAVWKQGGELLSNLHDWRQSVEPGVSKLMLKVSDAPEQSTNDHYEGDPDTIQLYELGIFNLLLIYLCQFLTHNTRLLHAVNRFACEKARFSPHRQKHKLPLLSPSVLPLLAPNERIKSAAAEIVTVCEWVHRDGQDGLMLAYLAIPMRVARDILADVGDARSLRLGDLLTCLSEFWSGRSS